jgi:hypothetical protein
VNHYAGIELAGNRVFVHYVLDLAEIPTFQSGDRVRAPGYAGEVVRDLELTLGGERTALRPVAHRISERKGAGGLPTLRFEAVFVASLHGTALAFNDSTFVSRIGWREITAARDGRSTSVVRPIDESADELRVSARPLARRSPFAPPRLACQARPRRPEGSARRWRRPCRRARGVDRSAARRSVPPRLRWSRSVTHGLGRASGPASVACAAGGRR